MAVAGFDQCVCLVPGLDASMRREEPVTTIALRGDGDLATLPALEALLDRVIAEHHGAVVVDLTEARFVGTASVCAFGKAAECLGDRDRLFTLRAPSRQALMTIAAFGFSHLVEATASA